MLRHGNSGEKRTQSSIIQHPPCTAHTPTPMLRHGNRGEERVHRRTRARAQAHTRAHAVPASLSTCVASARLTVFSVKLACRLGLPALPL
eukprot:358034-Chlamydomonas_euryale.AAC.1